MVDFTKGDLVENIAASKDNPHKLGVFVKYTSRSYTTRYRIKHTTHYAQYRCNAGKLHLTPPENLRSRP